MLVTHGIGGRTVEELERTMSARAFEKWKVYYSIEPFGQWRSDYQAGMIASIIANVNRDAKKKPQPYSPEDFMLKIKKPGDKAKQLKARLGHLVE